MSLIESIPEWATAIGTVSAVVLALFQKPIRDHRNRPKIVMSYNDSKQCRAEIASPDSSDSSKQQRIRIKLENTGRSSATDVALYVDSYYKKRDDGGFVPIDIGLKQLKDYRNTAPSSIAPHLQYYFEVASIKKYESMTTQDIDGRAKQLYKLYLLGEGNFTELGKGTFIIPLKFYSSSIDVQIYYLKIYWGSDNYQFDKQNFSAEMLSDKEFNTIQIVK